MTPSTGKWKNCRRLAPKYSIKPAPTATTIRKPRTKMPTLLPETATATATSSRKENIKILYLYRQIMPYNLPVFAELQRRGGELHVFQTAKSRLSPFELKEFNAIRFHSQEDFSYAELLAYVKEMTPDLVFICDRTVPKYNRIGIYCRQHFNTPVVIGCDSQWKGGKQWLNVLTAPFRHQRYYTHMMVAGVRQYTYAKKLGFRDENVRFDLYSANTSLFLEAEISEEKFARQRNFLFVGRMAEVKGVDTLIRAWSAADTQGHRLRLVGSGPLEAEVKAMIEPLPDVEHHPFMDQEDLLRLTEDSCCFVLPSRHEPWGVVIHEFAAAGLPLITSEACGASTHFVINNYNGFVCPTDQVAALRRAIESIVGMSDAEITAFAQRSRALSHKISPQTTAANLLSVLK